MQSNPTRVVPDEFHYYIIKIFYVTIRALVAVTFAALHSLRAYHLQVVHYTRVHRN